MSDTPNPETTGEERFSQRLRRIQLSLDKPTVRVAELEKLLPGRVFASAMALLCLPFLQPVPVPGLSVGFGLIIVALGARLAYGKVEALPRFLANREINSRHLRRILIGAEKLFLRLDPLFRHRLPRLVEPPFERLVGLGCMVGGLAMALPLPPIIVLSNGLPAFGVILLCLGWIEQDGLFVLVGHIVTLGTWIYFAFWGEALRLVALELWEKWS